MLTTNAKRRAYALASTVGLLFLMTILLGVAVIRMEHSSMVMEAHSNRFHARNSLESMTNMALRWLAAEVRTGNRPRAQAAVDLRGLTDYESLRIFTWANSTEGFDGGEVRVYDLEYSAGSVVKPMDMNRIFPPSFPGGYMIRATVERSGLAPMTLESVFVVTPSLIPGGSIVEVLDEKAVYSRELFRR